MNGPTMYTTSSFCLHGSLPWQLRLPVAEEETHTRQHGIAPESSIRCARAPSNNTEKCTISHHTVTKIESYYALLLRTVTSSYHITKSPAHHPLPVLYRGWCGWHMAKHVTTTPSKSPPCTQTSFADCMFVTDDLG